MSSQGNPLGIMRPVGGGDPVPLRKYEMIVGRRASCDICLDFENVSGKHCALRYNNQVWYVRDLGSTNGTRLNGAVIASEHSLMPDDELGIAGHVYKIDYEPGVPDSILHQGEVFDGAIAQPKHTSLLELAGLADDEDRPRRPTKASTSKIEHASVDEEEFEDELPDHVKALPAIETSEEDFFKLIEEEVKKPGTP